MATTISRTWYDTLVDDDGSGTTGSIWDKADVDSLLDAIDTLLAASINFGAVNIYINDTANANMTVGLTINQGASDDEILTLKSSDVAHGVTTLTETDTFLNIYKFSSTGGGAWFRAFSDTAETTAFAVQAVGDTTGTSKSTSVLGVVDFQICKPNGTGVQANTGNTNMLTVRDNATTRFILDSDGDSHQDVGTAWTNFDDGDDIVRLDAIAIALARDGDPLREVFVRSFEDQRAVIEAMPGKPLVTFNDDGHHFMNMSRLAMLHTGAIRQMAQRLARLEQTLLGPA